MQENTNAEITPKAPTYKGFAFGVPGKPNCSIYKNSRGLWFYNDGTSDSEKTRSLDSLLESLKTQGYAYYLE